jgi:hypothetical protein
MIFGTKRIEQLEEKINQLGLDNNHLENRIDAQAKVIKGLQELVHGQIKENLSLVQALKGHIKQVAWDEKNVIEELRRMKAREYARKYYQRKKAAKEKAK